MADNAVPQAIESVTNDPHVREAMMLGSYLESSWNASAVGDGGHSFGAFQMNDQGMLASAHGTPAQAEDPKWAAQAMLSSYQRAVGQVNWNGDPEMAAEQAAVLAERPAQPYIDSRGKSAVDAAWQATQSALGGAGSTGDPGINADPSLFGIPNPLNPSTWVSSIMSMLGIGSLKDLLERGALIVFGGMLLIVGILMMAKAPIKQTVGGIVGGTPEGQAAQTAVKTTKTAKPEKTTTTKESGPKAQPASPQSEKPSDAGDNDKGPIQKELEESDKEASEGE